MKPKPTTPRGSAESMASHRSRRAASPMEEGTTLLQGALETIANSGDCWQFDSSNKEEPCSCPVCTAKAALAEVEDWRYRGAMWERTLPDRDNPRERAIMDAFRRHVNDVRLAQVLREDTLPTVRDWYVAASVVQWMTTNVGSQVLEEAGWQYMRWDVDRLVREERFRAQEQARAAREKKKEG